MKSQLPVILNNLLLLYTRYFPLPYFKKSISKFVDTSIYEDIVEYENTLGLTYYLDLNEHQMKQIFLYDINEKNTIRHLLSIFENCEQVIFADVGANIGLYTMTLSKSLGNKQVIIHSFEPNPTSFLRLQKHIEENSLENICLNKMGLSSKVSEQSLFFEDAHLGGATLYSGDENSYSSSVKVRVDTLDNYCSHNNIQNIDLIKVDIEGGELEFLKGAREIIASSNKMVIVMEMIESHCERAGYSVEKLFNYMVNIGFRAYLPKPWPLSLKEVKSVPKSYHDNLIFIKD